MGRRNNRGRQQYRQTRSRLRDSDRRSNHQPLPPISIIEPAAKIVQLSSRQKKKAKNSDLEDVISTIFNGCRSWTVQSHTPTYFIKSYVMLEPIEFKRKKLK